MACLVLGKGLSPICSSMTSLPPALSRLATARTSNAVSATRPSANRLSFMVATHGLKAIPHGPSAHGLRSRIITDQTRDLIKEDLFSPIQSVLIRLHPCAEGPCSAAPWRIAFLIPLLLRGDGLGQRA